MPEKDDKSSSGMTPGARQPTIIRIGNGGGKTLKPTCIPSGTKPAEDIDRPQPVRQATVIGVKPGEPKPVQETAVPKPTVVHPPDHPGPNKAPVVNGASMMPGTVRKTLEVAKSDLASHYPLAADAILSRACEILRQVVVETFSETKCLRWMTESQQRYGALVQESLKLTSDKIIQDSTRHLVRLLALLEEICSSLNEKGSFFGLKKKSPLEIFQRAEPEILQLAGWLSGHVDQVIDIRSKIDGNHKEYSALSTELNAASIAANYLSERLAAAGKDQEAVHMQARSISLAQSVAQLQQGDLMRQSTVQQIARLILQMQDGVMVKLPAWIEQIMHYRAKTALTETDVYDFRQGLDELINQLK